MLTLSELVSGVAASESVVDNTAECVAQEGWVCAGERPPADVLDEEPDPDDVDGVATARQDEGRTAFATAASVAAPTSEPLSLFP